MERRTRKRYIKSKENGSKATTVAQGISSASAKPEYDASCKRVLSEKIILAWIMKECVSEFKDCDINDIARKYIEGHPGTISDEDSTRIHGIDTQDKTVHEGDVFFDLLFQAMLPDEREALGLFINVEAQKKFSTGYPLSKRGIFYCARVISFEYGKVFTSPHYGKIKKVYSIWICPTPPKKYRNTIVQYRIERENIFGKSKEPVKNYDLISVIIIGLGGPKDKNSNDTLRMLSTLFSKINADKKQKILEQDFKIPMTQTLKEELTTMCNLSEAIEEKGIRKGVRRGRAEKESEMIRKFKKLGVPLETIAEASGKSLEYVQSL